MSVEASGRGLASGPEIITYSVLYPIRELAKTGFRCNLDNFTGHFHGTQNNCKDFKLAVDNHVCRLREGGTENTGASHWRFRI